MTNQLLHSVPFLLLVRTCIHATLEPPLKHNKSSMAVMFGCVWMCNNMLGRFEIAVRDELHGVLGVPGVFGALGVLEASS